MGSSIPAPGSQAAILPRRVLNPPRDSSREFALSNSHRRLA